MKRDFRSPVWCLTVILRPQPAEVRTYAARGVRAAAARYRHQLERQREQPASSSSLMNENARRQQDSEPNQCPAGQSPSMRPRNTGSSEQDEGLLRDPPRTGGRRLPAQCFRSSCSRPDLNPLLGSGAARSTRANSSVRSLLSCTGQRCCAKPSSASSSRVPS